MSRKDWPQIMIDPLLELVFKLDGNATAAEAAMLWMYNTPENMWPPLDPLPKVFEGTPWKTRMDVVNHMHVPSNKVMTYKSRLGGHPLDEVIEYEVHMDRITILELLQLMMQFAPNKTESWGGPTAAGQIAHAFGRLLAHLPAAMVDEAIAIYQMNPRPKSRRL